MSLPGSSKDWRPVVVLVSLALAAVCALVLAGTGSSSAGSTVNCSNPIAAPGASVTFEPTEATAGDALSVVLNTNEGAAVLDSAVEAFLGSSPADIQSARMVGEGTLTAFSSMATVNGTVPDLTPGTYGVLVCWQVIPIEGAAFWQWDFAPNFELTGEDEGPVDCSNPVAAPGADIEFQPDVASAGSGLQVMLDTNEGVPPLDGQVETFLGSGPADAQAANMVGEGILPAFSSTAVVNGIVPDLPQGDYGVLVCWQVIPIEGAAIWQWDVQPTFTLTSGTPGPTFPPTPTPSPTPTPPPPTPTPSAAPTPRLRPFPELAPIIEEFQIPPAPAWDYSIFGIEMTQGIQCFDTSVGLSDCGDNSLSLVTQKSTMARIYLQLSGPGATELAGVPVRLHLFADGEEYVLDTYGTARTSIRQDLSDSANVWFNVDVDDGIEVEYYAEVDPDGLSAETDTTNNRFPATGRHSIEFHEREDEFDVIGWRMRYHPAGFTGNQYATGWAVTAGGYQWLNEVWPIEEGGINYGIRSGYMDWTSPTLADTDGAKVLRRAKSDWLVQAIETWGVPIERVHVWTPRSNFIRGLSDPFFLDGDGIVSVGDNCPCASDTMDDPGFGVINFVHEVTHNTNIKHTATGDTCGLGTDNSSATDPEWPYSDPTIQEFGYNPDTGKIHNPSSSYDFMAYCYSNGQNNWISPFHWQKQFDLEGSGVGDVVIQSANGPVIGITATLDNPDLDGDTGGNLDTMYRSETGNIVAPAPGSGYSVQLRAGNTVLAEQPFDVNFVNLEDPGNPLPDGFVAFSMAAPAGATSVVLLRGSQVLDTQPVSEGSPTVTFTDPVSHQDWTAGTTETIAWTGSDPDGDPLVYSVFYSKDGGTSFEVLQSDLTATSFTVEVDSLAGAEEAVFRVMASDGVNTGTGDSASVTVPNKAPFVDITGPANDSLAEEGGLVVLQGGAVDLEDGSLEDADLEWSSDRDGELGTGSSLPLNTLSGGEHEITLTAMDSDGAQSTDTITLFVGVRGAVRFVRSVVDPADPQNVTAIVTLPPGMPTTEIDEASLQLRIGGALVAPIGTEQLGDTNADGLPELAVTFAGQALVNAIPNALVQTNVVVVGEMDDNTPFQAKGVLAEIAAGDADCSGILTASDATRVLAHVAQIRTVDCLIAVDMDCDTVITAHDALAIVATVAGVNSGLTNGCEVPTPAAVSATASDRRNSGAPDVIPPVYFAAFLGFPSVMPIRKRPGERK